MADEAAGTAFAPWQKAVLDTYGGGDFSERWDTCEEFEAAAKNREVGDTLLVFLVLELAVSEGCDSWEEAQRRIDRAADDVAEAMTALVAAQVEARADGPE